jgi:CRP/FNR family transcriptional regulator, cyclic AMP receptor protein
MLGRIPAAAREQLLAEAVRIDLPRMATLFREGEPPRVALLLSGLVRSYRTLSDGRQLTVIYDHPGSLVALIQAFGRRTVLTTQTVTPCALMLIRATTVREVMRSSGAAALAIAEANAGHVLRAVVELAGHTTGPVHSRVSRYLLKRVAVAVGGPHEIEVTQQEVADAVGATRETVGRALNVFEAEGAIRLGIRHVHVVDADLLDRL